VLAAGVAELGEFKTAGGGLLVFCGGVVPVFAIRALQCDDLAHYGQSPSNVASHFGWQAACTELLPTRRDAGLYGPCCRILILKRKEERSGHARPLLLSIKISIPKSWN
jgi:hypothetical protein